MWWIVWAAIMLFVLTFNYSVGETNEAYDMFTLQQKYFDRYVNNISLVFIKYIGNDRCEIKQNQYALASISTTDDNKIKIEFDEACILYDDFRHFNCDWKFDDEDCLSV